MATINDVAKLAGVSPTTAKRALNEPHKLQPATLQKVQWAIEQLDYEPDLTAGALRRGRNLTVGLLVGDIVEPFFAELARGIGDHLRKANYGLLLADSGYQSEIERHNLRHLAGQRVSALIIRPSYGQHNRDYLLKMQEKGTYIIEVDHHMDDSPFDFLMLHHEQCIQLGLQHLWKLGHTRIAGLGIHHPELHPEWRAYHFERIMKGKGYAIPDAYRRLIEYNEHEAYLLARDLLQLPERPTALFAFNGTEAIGAYRAIQELGLRIPEDISLLAFDNLTWTSLVKPGIDVIEQPVHDMAALLTRQVLQNIDGAGKPMKKLMEGKLVVRGSCAAPAF